MTNDVVYNKLGWSYECHFRSCRPLERQPKKCCLHLLLRVCTAEILLLL